MNRIANRLKFLPLILFISIQANCEKCDSYSCDSSIVMDILVKNGYAIKFENIGFGSGKRMDTLILDDDVLKSKEVRTVRDIHRIVDLSELRYLDLNIHWADTIPNDLDKLENLETLIIGIPRITELPEKIFEIATLRKLDLEGSKIKTLNDKIGNLENLEYLSLYASNLNALPATIGDLANLRFLNLADNELSGFPSSVLKLSNLDTLHSWYNRLCDLDSTMETWVGSVDVYDGWKESQDCSAQVKTRNLPGLRIRNGYPWHFFDALGKERNNSFKRKTHMTKLFKN